jgi:hypothetical protein
MSDGTSQLQIRKMDIFERTVVSQKFALLSGHLNDEVQIMS